MIAGTLWSLRCEEWLLCCSTRHGRLVSTSVHRHAVQILFDLSQAWSPHARLHGMLFRQLEGSVEDLSRLSLIPTRQSHQRFCVAEG